MSQELEPISPAEAKEMYRGERKGEVSERTLQAHHYRLKHFIRWCVDIEGIENLNKLSGRDLKRFKTWRRDVGDLNKDSVHTQLGTLRVFIRWCGSINAVDPNLHEKFEALMPTLDKTDEQKESILNTNEARNLLEYQRRFEYASRSHVILEILWHTGIRLGALYSRTWMTTMKNPNGSNFIIGRIQELPSKTAGKGTG